MLTALLLALTFNAKVLTIPDGDTITVAANPPPADLPITNRIRLAGIDAPEIQQHYGPESRDYLRTLIPRGTTITLEYHEPDQYNRLLCTITRGELNINHALVTNGCAWRYPFAHDKYGNYQDAENTARTNHHGLWTTNAPTPPIPPWQYKRQNPKQ